MDIFLHKNQKARARVLAGLLDQPCQDYELLTKKLHVTLAVLRAMEEQGILLIESQDALRNPLCYRRTEEKETILRRSRNRRFLFLHKIMRMVTGTRILSME